MEYVLVGLGGFLGALSRYGLSKWVGQRWPKDFPLATFFINITGSFMLGLLFMFCSRPGAGLTHIRDFAATGYLGAFTTYSTFSYEMLCLITNGKKGTAAGYFVSSLAAGLVSAYAGMALAEYL